MPINETIRLIQSHRSIRRFQSRAIEPELFEQLLLSGQAASTSSFIQAVSVIRVQDPSTRKEFVELTGGQRYIAEAAEFLVFCADLKRNQERSIAAGGEPDFGWAEQFLAASVDVALFAQNMVIAAESSGLGVCYIGGIRNDPEKVNELLKLPTLVYPVFGLCIGYSAQDPIVKPRLPVSVVCHQSFYRNNDESDLKIDAYDQQIKDYYIRRSSGKVDFTWSDQMKTQAATQRRPFMLGYLRKKGFVIR